MAFDNKVYPNRKDNRRNYKYSLSKRVCRGCRNHGSCKYCEKNRTINTTKIKLLAKYEIKDLDMDYILDDTLNLGV